MDRYIWKKETTEGMTEETDSTVVLVKCTKQLAQNAKKNAMYRSNLLKVDQFIVETASQRKRDTKVFSDFFGNIKKG